MGGRGSFAAGIQAEFSYKSDQSIGGVKVLTGLKGHHSLPEEAHSSRAYIKLKPNGTFHEMRFHDRSKRLVFEIAYHPERRLGSPDKDILHYHRYDTRNGKFDRSIAIKLPKWLYIKFRGYFVGVTNG